MRLSLVATELLNNNGTGYFGIDCYDSITKDYLIDNVNYENINPDKDKPPWHFKTTFPSKLEAIKEIERIGKCNLINSVGSMIFMMEA